MNDCKEAITIPDGCYATIEGNKVVFRKWAYPIPRALEVAALHWRMDNTPSSPDTIGAFVSGASIELSADGPLKDPYAVYFQGGLTYPHAKYGILMSLQKIVEKDLIMW